MYKISLAALFALVVNMPLGEVSAQGATWVVAFEGISKQQEPTIELAVNDVLSARGQKIVPRQKIEAAKAFMSDGGTMTEEELVRQLGANAAIAIKVKAGLRPIPFQLIAIDPSGKQTTRFGEAANPAELSTSIAAAVAALLDEIGTVATASEAETSGAEAQAEAAVDPNLPPPRPLRVIDLEIKIIHDMLAKPDLNPEQRPALEARLVAVQAERGRAVALEESSQTATSAQSSQAQTPAHVAGQDPAEESRSPDVVSLGLTVFPEGGIALGPSFGLQGWFSSEMKKFSPILFGRIELLGYDAGEVAIGLHSMLGLGLRALIGDAVLAPAVALRVANFLNTVSGTDGGALAVEGNIEGASLDLGLIASLGVTHFIEGGATTFNVRLGFIL